MKDVIYEVIRKFCDGKYNDIAPKYGLNVRLCPRKDEDVILVFEDWDSVRAMEKVLLPMAKTDPEFDARFVREDKYDTTAIDFLTDGDWTFSDEGFVCDDCGYWNFYDERNGCSYQNYHVGDGHIQCENCIKENPDAYFTSIVDNPRAANTIFNNKELEDMGFEKLNNKGSYAHGWYGREADPRKIYDIYREQYPHSELLFSIRKTYNPWETEFDLWVRVADKDEVDLNEVA